MDDVTFAKLMDIFEQAQATWTKMESIDAGSEDWRRLRAEHAALAALYRDVRCGVATTVN